VHPAFDGGNDGDNGMDKLDPYTAPPPPDELTTSSSYRTVSKSNCYPSKQQQQAHSSILDSKKDDVDYSAESSRNEKDPTDEEKERRLKKILGFPFDYTRELQESLGEPNGAEEEAVPL
jgi:hypothetical protein